MLGTGGVSIPGSIQNMGVVLREVLYEDDDWTWLYWRSSPIESFMKTVILWFYDLHVEFGDGFHFRFATKNKKPTSLHRTIVLVQYYKMITIAILFWGSRLSCWFKNMYFFCLCVQYNNPSCLLVSEIQNSHKVSSLTWPFSLTNKIWEFNWLGFLPVTEHSINCSYLVFIWN